MKLMIYDDKQSTEEFINLIKTIPVDIKVDVINEYEAFLETYNSRSYDVVFINTNDIVGRQLKQEIVKNKPSQRIASINNSLECSDPLGCEHCKETTNSYRIFKPFRADEIIKSLKNVKCDTNYSDGRLAIKLHIFAKAIDDLEFDEDTYRYTIKSGNKNDIFLHMSSIFHLTDMLRKDKIEHVVENNYIQVLKREE